MAERNSGQRRKKIAVSCIAGILLSLLYVMIFSFSGQDGEQSGSLSQYISEKCVEILNALSGNHWTELMMQGLAEYFEHPIRKAAHFAEYACMGILLYALWSQWCRRGKKLTLLCVVWVFLSAAADEFHQYFVPGRYSSFADVLLDTCGGAFGVLLCIWLGRLAERRHNKRMRKKTELFKEKK